MDDWGHYDLGVRRPANDTEVHTPNLDALARGGLMMEQAYTAMWCTPSRSAFLSGRLPLHVFETKTPSITCWDYKNPDGSGTGIPRNMTTLPRFLKRAGYSTHMAGKFDAGIATPTHPPEGRGFDSSLIYFQHDNDYWRYNMTDAETQILFPRRCDSAKWWPSGWTDLWMDGRPHPSPPYSTASGRATSSEGHRVLDVTVIAQHEPSAGKPLFLSTVDWASHVAHAPLQVPQEYLDRLAHIPDPTPTAKANA